MQIRFLCNLIIILLPFLCFAAPKVPEFLLADFIEYNEREDFIYAKGNIKVTLDNYLITAHSLLYDIRKDLIWAEGDVKIKDSQGKIIYGQAVFLKDKLKVGIISEFILKFSDNVILTSRLGQRINENKASLHKSRFTPCKMEGCRNPVWQIAAQKTYIDLDKERITSHNLFFEVYGIPVFYLPYFSYPTPGAKAQSGILVPDLELKQKALRIPLYLRLKPNLDFTLAPKITKKYLILEGEIRHKLSSGSYTLKGSIGNPQYKALETKRGIKKFNKYHIFAKGNFVAQDYKYGFDLKRTSNKAYLKNSYMIYDSYLTSRLYLTRAVEADYFSIESLYFQGLQATDSHRTDPLIWPKIKAKKVINLNDSETTQLIITNNTLTYTQPQGVALARSAFEVEITNNIIAFYGNMLAFTARTRGDLYLVNDKPQFSDRYNILARNIPEIEMKWRYPLINHITANSSIIFEPIANVVAGRKFRHKDHNFEIIDPASYEIGFDNIFSANRYSGIDFHEFGSRLNCGFNTGLLTENNFYNLSLAQSWTKQNNTTANRNLEKVGKISANFNSRFELFYGFRKNKHFKPIKDEIGTTLNGEKIQLTASLIKLTNLKKYYAMEKSLIPKNQVVNQLYYHVSYQLTPNWVISYANQVDLSGKKYQLLYKTIMVTYLNDCVSISGTLYDNYTSDHVRGIKKIRTQTISFGFKGINM